MSDYRRLISYIYAYEGGEKGKNIGFAKIDMRGLQCRIQVNVKKVYVGSSDVGVYLLHSGGELLLGRIFIRSGAGEYRTQVQSENVPLPYYLNLSIATYILPTFSERYNRKMDANLLF